MKTSYVTNVTIVTEILQVLNLNVFYFFSFYLYNVWGRQKVFIFLFFSSSLVFNRSKEE